MSTQDTGTPGFGVYVHWPFCQSKCPYCDFNSHVRETVDEARWRTALLAEIAHAARIAPGRRVTSVFFGGGTPSLMSAATVAAVLDAVAGRWPLSARLEVTLEANPGSVEAGRFDGYRVAGVNRLSLGIQALDDGSLARLGRRHDRAQALAALDLALGTFERVSFDLIYARPGQTPAAWGAELGEAISLGTDHLALYQLTIEPGTAFHALARRGELDPAGEDDEARMYATTQTLTEAAGLAAYEISNHARPGEACRHNMLYWRSGEWVGIGPGAHGRLDGDGGRAVARRQQRTPEAWLAAVEAHGHGAAEVETVDEASRVAEVLMMGLRLREGLSRADLLRGTGRDIRALLPAARLAPLVEAGLLSVGPERIAATDSGRRVLNALLARLLA